MRALVLVGIIALGASATAAPAYERYCAACHGDRGDGRGPAALFLWPAPRDFTREEMKWGAIDETVREGTGAMPGFAFLDDATRRETVAAVKAFGARDRTIVDVGAAPRSDAARGAALWERAGCASCHPRSYDLLANGLHRPGADRRRGAALTIANGVGAMPGYAGAMPREDLWALADRALELAGPSPSSRTSSSRAIPATAITRDRANPWKAGAPVPPQGPPPASLAPAEASLSARQCARCHAKQYREWRPSVHAGAVSPGFLAETEFFDGADARASCLRCHAPLDEQRGDRQLAGEGATCAGCHLRAWTRRGPPGLAPSLATLPAYPFEPSPAYERADFCMPCHQLAPRDAVNGKPLLDTYREWLAGPYARRGVQCQSCHMPNREHSVLGVHDPETFRQGIRLDAQAHRSADGRATIAASLTNVGAGHALPTTATPAALVTLELLDARGRPIATDVICIGRDVFFDGAWHERSDTRIRPGETRPLSRAWIGGSVPEATHARVTIEVHPDEYYEHLYERRLAEPSLPTAQRALFAQALARARANHYIAEQRTVALSSPVR